MEVMSHQAQMCVKAKLLSSDEARKRDEELSKQIEAVSGVYKIFHGTIDEILKIRGRK